MLIVMHDADTSTSDDVAETLMGNDIPVVFVTEMSLPDGANPEGETNGST